MHTNKVAPEHRFQLHYAIAWCSVSRLLSHFRNEYPPSRPHLTALSTRRASKLTGKCLFRRKARYSIRGRFSPLAARRTHGFTLRTHGHGHRTVLPTGAGVATSLPPGPTCLVSSERDRRTSLTMQRKCRMPIQPGTVGCGWRRNETEQTLPTVACRHEVAFEEAFNNPRDSHPCILRHHGVQAGSRRSRKAGNVLRCLFSKRV